MKTKNYRIDLKIKNNNILSMIDYYGYTSVADFCNKNNFHSTAVGKYVNLKKSPLSIDGQLRKEANDICTALKVSPDMLWPKEMELVLQKNTGSVELNFSEVQALVDKSCPETQAINDERKEIIKNILADLPKRMADILSCRYGLNGDHPMYFEEIAKKHNLSRGRIMQIEAKALRIIRNPKISEKLNEGQ
jgi:RNA polymerase sigma factor (sigma-70 family)